MVLLAKASLVAAVVRAFSVGPRTALAVGLSMAHIGEFGFVLLSSALHLDILPMQVRQGREGGGLRGKRAGGGRGGARLCLHARRVRILARVWTRAGGQVDALQQEPPCMHVLRHPFGGGTPIDRPPPSSSGSRCTCSCWV